MRRRAWSGSERDGKVRPCGGTGVNAASVFSETQHLVAVLHEIIKVLLGCRVSVLGCSQAPGAHAGTSGIKDAVTQGEGFQEVPQLMPGGIHLLVFHRAAVKEEKDVVHFLQAKIGEAKGVPKDLRVFVGTDDSHLHCVNLLWKQPLK
jgi:hypothetical protein